MAYTGKRLYEMLANDLGDALYRATSADEATRIQVVINDVRESLALNDPRFNRTRFTNAVDARVSKRAAELAEQDRVAQMERY